MIDGLITAIVRPIRAKYTSLELGPSRIRYGDIEYIRHDFQVQNYRGLQIQGSFWSIMNKEYEYSESCILYLHPNSGSRVDVVKNARIMSIAAHTRCNVCSFDFSGCGESDGDCISLGVREKEDVCAIMSYLLSKGCRRFILWGRSMGAATALMFYGAYKELLVGTVVALILDSPFTSLNGIATQYTQTRSVPGLILTPALQYIRHNIHSQYGFDIMLATPITAAQRINIPAIVLSGGEDKTVPPILSEEIYNALAGPKLRIYFAGSHNSKRPSCIYELLRVFLPGVLKGLPINELLETSANILKKDIIPEKDIHGIPKDVIEMNLEISAPSEETCLLDEQKYSSSTSTTLTSASLSVSPTSSSTLSSSTPQNPKQSPNSMKKKYVHKYKSNEKLNPSPWNQKEIFRENHSYGINSNQNLHQNSHLYNGIQRRNTTTTNIHPHIQCHNQILNHSNRHPHSQLHPNHQHFETKSIHKKHTPPSIYSVSYEKVNINSNNNNNNNTSKQQLAIPSEESVITPEVSSLDWIGVIGSIFWGTSSQSSTEISSSSPNNFQRPISYGGSPAGSLGYLLHHLESDICPPESNAWESVLLARAIEDITDAVLTQVLPLAVGLLEVSIENQKRKLSEFVNITSPSNGSQIFQQVSSDLGLVTVDPNESLIWAKLLFLSPRELFSFIQDKEQEKEDQHNNSDNEHELEHEEIEDENATTTSEDKSHSCSSGNSIEEFNQIPSKNQDQYSTNSQSEERILKTNLTSQISKPTN